MFPIIFSTKISDNLSQNFIPYPTSVCVSDFKNHSILRCKIFSVFEISEWYWLFCYVCSSNILKLGQVGNCTRLRFKIHLIFKMKIFLFFEICMQNWLHLVSGQNTCSKHMSNQYYHVYAYWLFEFFGFNSICNGFRYYD